MSEILTLSLGSASNYTSVHYWNSLAKSPSKMFFRSTDKNEHTPRHIYLEVKEKFGSFRYQPAAEEEADQEFTSTWSGRSLMVSQEPFEPLLLKETKTLPDDLLSKIKYWCDFNVTSFHQRSAQLVPVYNLRQDQEPFSIFQQGIDLFQSRLEFKEELFDEKIRYFLEECDSPQGFNVLADHGSGFGGLTSAIIQEINDLMPKMAIHVYGLNFNEKNQINLFNEARFLSSLCDLKSTFVPVNAPLDQNSKYFEQFSMQMDSFYLKSAFSAAAIATITSALSDISMFQVSKILASNRGYPLAALATAIPFNQSEFSQLFKKKPLNSTQEWLYNHTLQESFLIVEKHVGSVSALRSNSPQKENSTIMDYYQFLSSFQIPYSMEFQTWNENHFNIEYPFPKLFKNQQDNVATFAKLYNCASLSGLIDKVAKDIPSRGFVSRIGEEADCYYEIRENLESMAQLYREL